jgi:hypothetical protein
MEHLIARGVVEQVAAAQSPNLRTGAELAIKTVTTHLFAIVNYAYMCALQRRPTGNGLHVLQIAVFAFVPTLIAVEFVNTQFRALKCFIQNQTEEEEEEKSAWFYISAGLGLHASMPITNAATKKDEIHKVPLLKLDPTLTMQKRTSWSWIGAGKMFATLFALTQAVGTVVMWARRINHGGGSCLGFDHRNGAMGVASTICSVGSILVLLLSYDWSVTRALQSPTTEKLHTSRTTLILQTFLAMTLHQLIAYIASGADIWLYTSSAVVFFITGLYTDRDIGKFFLGLWQTILLAVFVLIFRKEIAARLGAQSGIYQAWMRHRSWKRIKAILRICLVLWFIADILKLLITDIVDVIINMGADNWAWWQDPVSDRIFVI